MTHIVIKSTTATHIEATQSSLAHTSTYISEGHILLPLSAALSDRTVTPHTTYQPPLQLCSNFPSYCSYTLYLMHHVTYMYLQTEENDPENSDAWQRERTTSVVGNNMI